jgi:hypothetical protein
MTQHYLRNRDLGKNPLRIYCPVNATSLGAEAGYLSTPWSSKPSRKLGGNCRMLQSSHNWALDTEPHSQAVRTRTHGASWHSGEIESKFHRLFEGLRREPNVKGSTVADWAMLHTPEGWILKASEVVCRATHTPAHAPRAPKCQFAHLARKLERGGKAA